MPDDFRSFDPPRAVEVEHEGHWYPGRQSAWARWEDGTWRASVTYTTEPGSTYLRQVPIARVRPRDG